MHFSVIKILLFIFCKKLQKEHNFLYVISDLISKYRLCFPTSSSDMRHVVIIHRRVSYKFLCPPVT